MTAASDASSRSEHVLVSLGSNLGDRRETLARAVREVAMIPGVVVVRTSSLWETEAWGGPAGQEPFLNAAVLLRVRACSPEGLLTSLQRIERLTGRVRTVRNGPRTLDLDILLFGDRVLSAPTLEIPHRGMHERSFVLLPAAEAGGDLVHPVFGRTVSELADEVGRAGIIGVVAGSGWEHAVGHPQGF